MSARDDEGEREGRAEPEVAVTTLVAKGDGAHGTKMVIVVLAMAAGFALVPRAMQSCDRGSGGEDAPDFTAPFLANAPVKEQKELKLSELRGKAVLLDFWATWCPPCRAELPLVNGIAQRYRDKGLVVVGVNVDDDDGAVGRFVSSRGVTFPIVHDDTKKISMAYHAENLPTLIVVGKDGKIFAVRRGLTSEADLENLVKKVL